MARTSIKHYNYSATELTGKIIGQVNSSHRKIPMKVIRGWQQRDDRLAKLDGNRTYGYCDKCGHSFSSAFLRAVAAGWNQEEGFICLDCKSPVE